ncbi:MAG TPA: hypothetical protein PKC21_09510 [Oligoflexia bacterium]|nr:hypothetical protein [Oligoflexia bacterium]HMR25574.1 hypothetical protein [Oligoflexia bacterium]
MQLINTGKYVLKFYFSDPGASPAWVSKSFKYIDKLPDNDRQSLIDIHFKNDGADVPLAFINLAKLGFFALEKRFQNSDQSLKLETLDEEFVILKQKIDTFVKENNFGMDKIEFYQHEMENLEKQLNMFSKKLKESKSFFYRKKDKHEKPVNKPVQNNESKKSKPRVTLLLFTLLITLSIVFHKPVITAVWQIFIRSKVDNISTQLKVLNYEIDGRRLTLFVDEKELQSKKYPELKDILENMMQKSFANGFENFVVKTPTNKIVAKNILVNNKSSLYLFYTPEQ